MRIALVTEERTNRFFLARLLILDGRTIGEVMHASG